MAGCRERLAETHRGRLAVTGDRAMPNGVLLVRISRRGGAGCVSAWWDTLEIADTPDWTPEAIDVTYPEKQAVSPTLS